MDLNQALVFVRVIETGSFTGAAQRLQMPKSTVSRRVAELEERLGVRLVQRTTRKLRLTEDGENYYRRAAKALSSLEQAERSLLGGRDVPHGELRITAPVDFGRVLGTLVARFCRRYPEVRVVTEVSQRKVDLVAEGFDVALRGGVLEDSSLVARRIRASSFGLYASPAYLERRGTPTRLSDLARHECILFGKSLHDVWRLEGPEGEEEVAVRASMACNDFSFMHRAAVEGAGIALLIRRAEVDRTLARVLPQYGLSARGVYAVYPSGQFLAPKVRAFVDFAAAELSEDAPLLDEASY